jgi:hypothetical protein
MYQCSAKIVTVDNKGIMKIKFNESMWTNINTTWINKSNTIIKVLPAN